MQKTNSQLEIFAVNQWETEKLWFSKIQRIQKCPKWISRSSMHDYGYPIQKFPAVFQSKFVQMLLNEVDTIGMTAGAGLEHCHLMITNINSSQEAKQILKNIFHHN